MKSTLLILVSIILTVGILAYTTKTLSPHFLAKDTSAPKFDPINNAADKIAFEASKKAVYSQSDLTEKLYPHAEVTEASS